MRFIMVSICLVRPSRSFSNFLHTGAGERSNLVHFHAPVLHKAWYLRIVLTFDILIAEGVKKIMERQGRARNRLERMQDSGDEVE